MNTLKYRSDIDGLRALAVLGVVIYHVSPQSLPGGFLGVDIFFVISGYLISLIVFREQAAGTFSFADFYARRARRLFPALAVVLLATIVFGAFALFADEYQRLGKHAASAIVFLLNFQLMGEAGYFDVASDSKPFFISGLFPLRSSSISCGRPCSLCLGAFAGVLAWSSEY